MIKKAIIFHILLFHSFLNAQIISIDFQGDTIFVNNVLNNIDKLNISKKITSDSLEKYYWVLYNLHIKDKVSDKEMLNISMENGDVFLGYFINKYVDSICIGCSSSKKYFIYWYLMNYYFVPTGLLYGDKENTFCPCYIKKLQFSDSGMYIVDSLNKLYCVPIYEEQKKIYKKIFIFNPLLKNWKNLVSAWGKVYPQKTNKNANIVKHQFEFFYKDSLYRDSINFNINRYYKIMPSLGKDASIVNEKLDYNIDTSLIKFLRNKILYMHSDIEKANFILSFVQQFIENKTDVEMFNVFDKTIMPEETLFKGAGDCEDKSFLLAYLFRNLIFNKNDVILIVYNDHVNVGIKLKKNEAYKDFVKYNNNKYILCETTNNSPIGFLTNSVLLDNILTIIPLK